jgi:trans-aconitate methyltransferase
MPIYKTKAEFLSVFFRPVIERSWKHLKTGGYLCLNMPEEMYEGCKDMLPALHETLEMPLANKYSKTSKGKRKELIYVWKKN